MLATVAEHSAQQRELAERGKAAAVRASRIGRLDLLAVTLAELMARAAAEAETAVDDMLTAQGLIAPPAGSVAAPLFALQASDGRPLVTLLERATSTAVLTMMAMTQVSDTWRSAAGASIAARPDVSGYVRHVGPLCCSRCAILSGRFYRWSAGFLRHPRCRCMNIPTTLGSLDTVTETPQELFEQGRITSLTKADARALEDGADIFQIVNARRRTAGMAFAQAPAIQRVAGNSYTTEGSTVRSRAYAQQLGLRRNGAVQARLMPESIYARAPNRDEAIRLLRLYGWISDDAAIARGRALLAPRIRDANNARARERRAAAR